MRLPCFDAKVDEFDEKQLTHKIERHLRDRLGFEVDTLLRSVVQVEAIFDRDPFAGHDLTVDTRHCITFLSKPLPPSVEVPMASPKGDWEIVDATDSEAFTLLHVTNGRSPNPTPYFEKSLKAGIRTTTRFYGTAAKILAAAQKEQ